MATFKIFYSPEKAKKDGHFVIYVILRHQQKQLFINTNLSAKVCDLKNGELDSKTRRAAENYLCALEDKYNKIHIWADALPIKELADELTKDRSLKRIDFLDFIQTRIDELFKDGRDGTAKTYVSLLYSLRDFRQTLYVDELNLSFLMDFEKYLRSPKTVVRKANNCTIEKKRDGYTENGTIVCMQKFKAIYNELARREDLPIKNPFLNYKFSKMKETKDRNLPVDTLRQIIRYDKTMRYPIARDCFLLSLYFCGINLIDLYETAHIENGRLEYNRKKTSRSRTDAAFSSIVIQPEAKHLIEKYTDNGRFIFKDFYPSFTGLTYAVNRGLDELCNYLKIDPRITYYQARHSVATIMSNELDIPDSHVKMVLNHNLDLGITNKYIKKDFSKLDRANRKFLDYLFADEYEDLI